MAFDPQPVLKGELLELRPLREDDWESLYAVASDPLLWEQHPASNRYQEAVFREFFRDGMASGGALLAIERASGRAIGSSRFYHFAEGQREIEIGWTFLARACWGGRYNGEMKHLMLTHAFRFIDSVVFKIGPQNMRSRKAVEKIGGVYVGESTPPDGRVAVVYRITASEFALRTRTVNAQ